MKNTDLLKGLDKGIDDVENGRVTSHEDTMKILLQQYNDQVLPQVAKRENFRTAFNNLRSGTADIPDMSLEEINAEISSIRANRKKRQIMVYAVIDTNVFIAALLSKKRGIYDWSDQNG